MPLNPVDIEEVPLFLVSITPVCLCYSQHQEHFEATTPSLVEYSLPTVNLVEYEDWGVEAVLELVLVLVELAVALLGVLVEEGVLEHLVQQ
jgi:hypothetical protein